MPRYRQECWDSPFRRRCSLEPEEVIEQSVSGVCKRIPVLHLLRAVLNLGASGVIAEVWHISVVMPVAIARRWEIRPWPCAVSQSYLAPVYEMASWGSCGTNAHHKFIPVSGGRGACSRLRAAAS